VKYRDFIRILLDNGFQLDRQSGSHRQYEGLHGGRRWLVTVACHSEGDEIGRMVLASMIRQSGLPKKLFR
jgi:predicted RNA binding protein YcfA (HicA-like mRNA interferase family)